MSKFQKLRGFAIVALKNWTKTILVCAALAAAFYYWFAFTVAQSIVLGILFGNIFVYLWALDKKTETTADFIPYRVSIRIHNHRDFLFKYRFVQTEEEWEKLSERVNDMSLLRRGMNFTVLSLSKDGLPHLIWWDDYKTFLAGLPSFEDNIQGIEFPYKTRFPGNWSPRLYFGYRHGTRSGGYNLAVCVTEGWWDENKTEKLEIEKDHITGSMYVTLGVLPYGELGLDYEARGQDRKKELERLGWTIKDTHDWEASWLDSIEVQNEYFSVEQRFLETD